MAAVSLFWDTNMAAVTSCEYTLLVAYCKNDCNQKGLLQNCFYLQQISKKQLKLKPNLNSKKFFKIA